MPRVCEEEYPKGFYKKQRKSGFYMNPLLKSQLDILLKNITDDWDFTIIVSGGGEVRVGKSQLAMQIGAYWKAQMKKLYNIDIPFNVEESFVFDGRELIKKGNHLGQKYKYSVLVFDEAGADLEGRKAMQSITQDVLDYYRECGQYNMLNILVLPEFFDLPKGIAMSRSIFLLDVWYNADEEGKFQRGYFNFYSKRNKKYLYLKGRLTLNYRAYRHDFSGRFLEFYPFSEEEYRDAKQKALSSRENKRRNKFQFQRDAAWFLLLSELNMTQSELGRRMEQLTRIYTPKQTISDAISTFKEKKEGFS